jgi:hypothetical protein
MIVVELLKSWLGVWKIAGRQVRWWVYASFFFRGFLLSKQPSQFG